MRLKNLRPAEQLTHMMDRVYRQGLTTASGGNISILDDNGDIWITPKATDKGEMKASQIVCVHPDGSFDGDLEPSSELPFHTAAYRVRKDIRAVLHAHADYCVAFSLTRTLPRIDLLDETRRRCARMSLSAYAMTGSDELGENISKEFAKGSDVVFLENHGVCVGGGDLTEAFVRFEGVEYAARLQALAMKLGRLHTLMNVQTDAPDDVGGWRELPQAEPFAEEVAARCELVKMVRRAYRRELFFATLGAASVRLSDGSFLVSPADRDCMELEGDDFVRVVGGAAERGKTPHLYARLHQSIYAAHGEANAILTAQPPYTTAFSVTDAQFLTCTIPESFYMLRDIPRAPLADMTRRTDRASALFSSRTPVVLFEKGGVTATGKTLFQAFDRLEVAEATAQSIVSARGIGSIVFLSEREIADIKMKFNLE
jgi:L-fuculose-phosphate aldolase